MKMMWLSTFNVFEILKVAVTLSAAVIFSLQMPVPLHAPDHPAKNAPFPKDGVSVTIVPAANEAVQVGAQLIPAGLLVTLPVEVPARFTVNSYVDTKPSSEFSGLGDSSDLARARCTENRKTNASATPANIRAMFLVTWSLKA